jgi:Protein kinase domain/GAF domain
VIQVAAICGAVLTLLETANHVIGSLPDALRDPLAMVGVVGRSNVYWAITFGLTAAAFPVLLARSRLVSGLERVRATWFTLSLIVGLGPFLVEVLTEFVSPTFESWAQSARVRPILGSALFLLCLTIPATSMYAVVVKRVLAVRVVLRRALQCALTKYVFVCVSLAPLVTVVGRMYSHRERTVIDLASDPWLRFLLILAFGGVLALVFTERILQRIDAIFSAPRYDAKGILAVLSLRLGRAADPAALTQILCRELGGVFQPFKVTAAVVDAVRSETGSLPLDHLPADSSLIDIMASLRTPNLEVSERLLRCVSARDAAWLAKTGAQLLVPLKSWDGAVLGVIALSERRSELPYSDEDRDFLASVAGSAALALDKERLRRRAIERRAHASDVDLPAFECRDCGLLSIGTGPSQCGRCGEPMELSCLPLNLHGKFRLERRLGQGGMGIVYLAVDTDLNRQVALKTLPFASIAAEQRLREEARTMARLKHQNLASIYGVEKWLDRPLLVVEYLENGTLAALLNGSRPTSAQVVKWGIDLCDGLQFLHEHALVHGDIKPSNIGFDRTGTSKLLDFGLTQTFCANPHAPHGEAAISSARWGTRQYACPEATATAPCPQFDLWSLALVLYEALAGERPIPSGAAASRAVPDIRRYRREVPRELADVFANALHLDIERRPRSAIEFNLWLQQVRPVG